MRTRAALAAGLVATIAVSGTANAAPHKKPRPKPVCNVVQDPSGDAPFDVTLGLAPGAMPNDPNGDILSADLSSDAKYVTAVIRVKSIAAPGTTWPLAHFYMLSWTAPGHDTPVYLGGVVDPDPAAGAVFGPQFVFGDGGEFQKALLYYNIDSTAVKGTIDTAKNTLTLSVPISAISAFGKFAPGNKFSGLQATSQALVNGPVLPTNLPAVGGSVAWGWAEDTADGTKNYTAGAPSCVKPGS